MYNQIARIINHLKAEQDRSPLPLSGLNNIGVSASLRSTNRREADGYRKHCSKN